MAALPVSPNKNNAAADDDDASSSAASNLPVVGGYYALPELPQKEKKRRQQIADAWKAYRGEWGPGPLKTKKDGTDRNIRTNLCQPIVDVGVNFLFGEVVRIELDNGTDGATGDDLDVDNGSEMGTSPAQAFLDECWGDDDDKMTLLTKLAMNGAIAGTAYLMIQPAPAQKSSSGRGGKKATPRIVVLDPENVTAIPDPHDCETIREYWIQYEIETYNSLGLPEAYIYRKVICRDDPDGLAALTGYGYDDDDTWQIIDYVQKVDLSVANRGRATNASGQWRCVAVTPWQKPYPPIVACQNLPNPNEFAGMPDLTKDLIQINRAVHFIDSNNAAIIENYAAPIRYAKGVTANQIRIDPETIILLQGDNAELKALDVQGDLANSMAFADRLMSAMDEQSQIPGIALGRMKDMPKGTITGPVFQALYKPPMAKTTKKRRLYGRLICEMSEHLLDLGGFASAAKANIRLHWQDVMPSDALVEAQAAQIWSGLGVSSDSLMQRYTDFDPDTEAEKKQQEQQRQMLAFSHGAGMPPMDPNALKASAQMDGGSDASQPGADDESANQQPQVNKPTPPVNHPAAQLARAKVKAAFGKPVDMRSQG